MKNSQEWFSVTELLEEELVGLPTSDKGITKKAEREKWVRRQREGVKGKTFEYHYTSFPEDIQKALGFTPNHSNIDNKLQESFNKLVERLSQKVGYIGGYDSLRVSAGFGDYNDGVSEPDTYVPYSERLLARLGINESNGVVFWAEGDSMQPTIDNGDQILVNLANKEIQEGKIYVIQQRGTMWVKRVQMGFNEVSLLSDNPAYNPIKISFDEADDLEVIGQVVHISKSIV